MTSAPDRVLTPRAAPRQKVFRLATLETATGRHRAHVLNLSAIGACLHSRAEMRAWSAVVLHLGDRAVPARVTWADGERCGVKFENALTPQTLDAMIA